MVTFVAIRSTFYLYRRRIMEKTEKRDRVCGYVVFGMCIVVGLKYGAFITQFSNIKSHRRLFTSFSFFGRVKRETD